MRSSTLRASIVPASGLRAETLDAMWALFLSYYEDVDKASFERDLRDKDHVILLRCLEDGSIQGFSTITSFEQVVEGRPVVGVFSGDTIVERRFWRQTALQRAFLSYVMRVKLGNLRRPVYWFLISKGFRTYLLMARNFPEHWPRYEIPTPPWQAAVIDSFARTRFSDAWRPELGILRFQNPIGRLKESVAPIDDVARRSPEVRFFEEMNPDHASGDELCCIAKVDGRLWASYTLKLLRRCLPGRRKTP